MQINFKVNTTCSIKLTSLEISPGVGSTPLYGLFRYVRPERVWFSAVKFLVRSLIGKGKSQILVINKPLCSRIRLFFVLLKGVFWLRASIELDEF